MPTVHRRAAARLDLVNHFDYLEEHAGLDKADRFLCLAEASFKELARQPGMGAPLTLHNPALAGMRKWRVRDFDRHLIFYMPRADGVSIVRVLHASSDWWTLLGLEG